MRKLDVFTHIMPRPYHARLMAVAPEFADVGKRMRNVPMLVDLDLRFRVMDRFDDYQQILSLANPPIEMLGSPDQTPELARLANDGMAALCQRHPDRFPGFIASLPLNNPAASLKETVRAVKELNARGIQPDADNREPWFLSYSHSEADINETLNIFDDVVADVKRRNAGRPQHSAPSGD